MGSRRSVEKVPGQPDLVQHVAPLVLDPLKDVVDALSLPGVQHRCQQRATVGEVDGVSRGL
jgi:hypothetical protein